MGSHWATMVLPHPTATGLQKGCMHSDWERWRCSRCWTFMVRCITEPSELWQVQSGSHMVWYPKRGAHWSSRVAQDCEGKHSTKRKWERLRSTGSATEDHEAHCVPPRFEINLCLRPHPIHKSCSCRPHNSFPKSNIYFCVCGCF